MRTHTREIRKRDIATDQSRVRSLSLDHEDLRVLRDCGIAMAGIDERTGPVKWGEGMSNTTLLFMLLEGTTTSLAGDFPVTAIAGECLIIPAGCAKILELKRGNVRSVWFHLTNLPRWAHLLGSISKQENSELIPLAYSTMDRLLQETLHPSNEINELGTSLAKTIEALLVIHFGQAIPPAALRIRQQLNHLWNLVSSDLARDWTVATLARQMHVSVGHLHRLVREHDHNHPTQIVTSLRMQRAAGLLRTTEYPLEQIAELVGYCSPYAFSAAFLREIGMRPGAYRKVRPLE